MKFIYLILKIDDEGKNKKTYWMYERIFFLLFSFIIYLQNKENKFNFMNYYRPIKHERFNTSCQSIGKFESHAIYYSVLTINILILLLLSLWRKGKEISLKSLIILSWLCDSLYKTLPPHRGFISTTLF